MALHRIRKDTKVYSEGWSNCFYCITIISMYDGRKHTCQNVSKDVAIGQVYAKHNLHIRLITDRQN